MIRDAHGLIISTTAEAAPALDRAILAYLKYRADTADQLGQLLAADPDFALAHCLKGYFAMLSFKRANVPVAMEAARMARGLMLRATAREQAHVAALESWIAGDLDGMI